MRTVAMETVSSVLHAALFVNSMDTFEAWLRAGVSPEVCNADGESILVSALRMNNLRAVAALLSCGAAVNKPCVVKRSHYVDDEDMEDGEVVDDEEEEEEGEDSWVTPLLAAVETNDDALVFPIVTACNVKDINAASPGRKRTALHRAAFIGELNIVKLLVAKGADVNVADADGTTPLSCAALEGNLDVVKCLMLHGAKPSAFAGWGPLHAAAVRNHVDVLQWLLAHGVDVNEPDDLGMTAHTLALANGHLGAADVLRRAGAVPQQFHRHQ